MLQLAPVIVDGETSINIPFVGGDGPLQLGPVIVDGETAEMVDSSVLPLERLQLGPVIVDGET